MPAEKGKVSRKRSSAEEEASASPSTLAAPAVVVEDEKPKVIMSRAARRKLKKPAVVVTAEMKENAREEKRELRKYLRMIKSNGARRKVAKLAEKREREDNDNEEAFDSDYMPTRRGRRLE